MNSITKKTIPLARFFIISSLCFLFLLIFFRTQTVLGICLKSIAINIHSSMALTHLLTKASMRGWIDSATTWHTCIQHAYPIIRFCWPISGILTWPLRLTVNTWLLVLHKKNLKLSSSAGSRHTSMRQAPLPPQGQGRHRKSKTASLTDDDHFSNDGAKTWCWTCRRRILHTLLRRLPPTNRCCHFPSSTGPQLLDLLGLRVVFHIFFHCVVIRPLCS